MHGTRPSATIITVAAFGFSFLYLPIILLIGYSFNESELVTVWTGFSTKWYANLLKDKQILNAAFLSVQIGAVTATLAVILGTLAGFALVRYGHFRGRTMLGGMIAAPLVMPEVITGLSLLLLFVALQNLIAFPDGRGALTITIAHITFCMAYVAVVVQVRLSDLDRDQEDAALDLGARPWKVFAVITLPAIAPALIAGWLLAFTLSLDDLVIASFVSGPGASTLPMVVFSKVRLGINPTINALATIIVVVVSIAVMAAGFVMVRAERRRERAVQAALAERETT